MTDQLTYAVVIPTIGRDALTDLVGGILAGPAPLPEEIVVVDDRRDPDPALRMPSTEACPTRVVASDGHGPAAARNRGWQSVSAEWVVFVDDDVQLPADWTRQVADDLRVLDRSIVASQARVHVPAPSGRPTDDQRRTLGLAGAQWITAEMAYRRSVLLEVGGFDPRFPRAYREDSDLGLRVSRAGHEIRSGERVVDHPIAPGGFLRSVKVQAGNADDALMRHKHGRNWRAATGAGPGRPGRHLLTVLAAAGVVAGVGFRHRRLAVISATAWATALLEFALRRIVPGPRTPREVASMLLTSALIPFAAITHRLRGEWHVRRPRAPRRPAVVLFDRDDTLIVDVPYLDDPDGVDPVPDAVEALSALRRNGIRTGIISNQSGVGRGLISTDALARVNARVSELLGPFNTWQVCPHAPDAGCSCRKPLPGMVRRAAEELGVPASECVVVGDIGADVEAARAAGADAILVPTNRTRPEEVSAAREHARVASSLVHAVDLIMGANR
ncbi:HAD-IIIA family hydrolase [Gordonia sp. DT219]|uniref:HAD-IIIA family hydrolase n=1 Tax=Gordonia sp. DT219 TaxID=3416658 RepID=UPI003CE9C250